MRDIDYQRPQSLQALWPLLAADPEARLLAGGTDLLVRLHGGLLRARRLVSLRGIAALRGVEVGEARVRIGAATTIADLLRSPALRQAAPVLCAAAARLGSPQIRNVATVGGNLCNASPCADTATPLLVLQASAEILGAGGARQVPLEDFFRGPGQTCLAPGEVLGAVCFDRPAAGAAMGFYKKVRVRMDLGLANLAALLLLRGGEVACARLAAGSVAPVPLRLRRTEALLQGQRLDAPLAERAQAAAAQEVSPITDLRTTAEYRRAITGVYVKRALLALAGLDPAPAGGAGAGGAP